MFKLDITDILVELSGGSWKCKSKVNLKKQKWELEIQIWESFHRDDINEQSPKIKTQRHKEKVIELKGETGDSKRNQKRGI